MTLSHYYAFGDEAPLIGRELRGPSAWDALRIGTSGPFALPQTRTEWEALAVGSDVVEQRARAVGDWLDRVRARRVASYGAGTAILEFWLHRYDPSRRLVLTETGPQTLKRLGALFPEVDVVAHDLIQDDPLEASVHIFNRIDTEFTDRDWCTILERFQAQRVLFIATSILSTRSLAREFRARASGRATKAGYARTRRSFEALWSSTHVAERLAIHDLQGWSLEPLSVIR